jgi:hypothetical protein
MWNELDDEPVHHEGRRPDETQEAYNKRLHVEIRQHEMKFLAEQWAEKNRHKRYDKIQPNAFRWTLDWQLSIGYGVKSFCPVCFWSYGSDVYQYCCYGHGAVRPISEYKTAAQEKAELAALLDEV